MRPQTNNTYPAVRKGLVDCWNAFMYEDAKFDVEDIPICETTAAKPPEKVISWPEAKLLHNKMLLAGKRHYTSESFIHFYVDDSKFDGPRSGVWQNHEKALEIISHFAGVITPDYSTYIDFPDPLVRYSTCRMRAFGHWLGRQGVAVINNVRWGLKDSWSFCFAGIPKNSIVSIGTVGGGPRKLRDRKRFREGFYEMLERIEPAVIIVVGSASDECFEVARNRGITIIQFDSDTATAFRNRRLVPNE